MYSYLSYLEKKPNEKINRRYLIAIMLKSLVRWKLSVNDIYTIYPGYTLIFLMSRACAAVSGTRYYVIYKCCKNDGKGIWA